MFPFPEYTFSLSHRLPFYLSHGGYLFSISPFDIFRFLFVLVLYRKLSKNSSLFPYNSLTIWRKNAAKTGSHSYFCRILNSLFIYRRIFHFSALPNVIPNTDPAFIFYCASPNRRLTALKIPLKDALVMLELMPTPYVTLPVFWSIRWI